VRGQSRVLVCRECHRPSGAGVPEHGDDSRLGGGRARRREDRLPRRQAGGAYPLHLDAHPELPVGVADLGAPVDLHPCHHVMRIPAERLHVESVPSFFQVGQEHRVVDVPQRVNIPPPQADLMLKDRVHELTLSPPGTANDRQRDKGADLPRSPDIGGLVSGERGPAQERVRLDRRVSVDLCFWASGDGDAGELYEDAADGVDHTFAASARPRVTDRVLRRWPDLADKVEPLEFDPDLDAPSDLSRFVLITLHASQDERIQEIVGLALTCGLTGYDPQTGAAIAR